MVVAMFDSVGMEESGTSVGLGVLHGAGDWGVLLAALSTLWRAEEQTYAALTAGSVVAICLWVALAKVLPRNWKRKGINAGGKHKGGRQRLRKEKKKGVEEEDLERENGEITEGELFALHTLAVETTSDERLEEDGWEMMMDKCSRTLRYRAWRRDLHNGLTEYRSSTVALGVSPAAMNEIYLDDENRLQWDFCFREYEEIEAKRGGGGGDIVRWVRKFPVCAACDYVLARRCYRVADSFYTVTRTTRHKLAPARDNLRRVDKFYSSWVCRPVVWTGEDEQCGQPAAETVLIHCEDLGLPQDLAKFAVRQGMWRMVRNLEVAIRGYHEERTARGDSPKRCLASLVGEATEISEQEMAAHRVGGNEGGDSLHSGSSFMKTFNREESAARTRRRCRRGVAALVVGGAVLYTAKPRLALAAVGATRAVVGALAARTRKIGKGVVTG